MSNPRLQAWRSGPVTVDDERFVWWYLAWVRLKTAVWNLFHPEGPKRFYFSRFEKQPGLSSWCAIDPAAPGEDKCEYNPVTFRYGFEELEVKGESGNEEVS